VVNTHAKWDESVIASSLDAASGDRNILLTRETGQPADRKRVPTMRVIRALSLAALGLTLIGLALTQAPQNAWRAATSRAFFVPPESSMFSFRVTEENPGSGEWWLRGEDDQAYFALHASQPVYLVLPRSEAARCPGFSPADQRSWCAPRLRPLP
jgi:hypothetical protein